MRTAAGAALPVQERGAILAGSLVIGDAAYGQRSYHLARRGISHFPIAARCDALFFIHGALL